MRWLSIASVCLVLSGFTLHSERIPVIQRQGAMHGFLVLRSAEGKIIATGDQVNVVKGNEVHSRLTLMQAASLFAFGAARSVAVASVAMVSNAVDHEGEQFDTGSQQDGLRIIQACARAFNACRGKDPL